MLSVALILLCMLCFYIAVEATKEYETVLADIFAILFWLFFTLMIVAVFNDIYTTVLVSPLWIK